MRRSTLVWQGNAWLKQCVLACDQLDFRAWLRLQPEGGKAERLNLILKPWMPQSTVPALLCDATGHSISTFRNDLDWTCGNMANELILFSTERQGPRN